MSDYHLNRVLYERAREHTMASASWGEVNPDFFKGTVVEKAAAEVLAPAAR